MPFEETEVTEAQLSQQQRGISFGARTAEKVRAAENCQFSLLPHEELSRLAASWYEACTQGMLRGNYAPLDGWIRSQSQLAAAEGFTPQDLFQLLQICRNSAIEMEGWNEEPLAAIEEVINEVFKATYPGFGANVAEKTTYPKSTSTETKPARPEPAKGKMVERRTFDRNRLQIAIRIRGTGDKSKIEEVTRTRSISRSGLYFVTQKDYGAEQILKITYPYWPELGAINKEYPAKIVRREALESGAWGVAVKFLQNLGGSTY